MRVAAPRNGEQKGQPPRRALVYRNLQPRQEARTFHLPLPRHVEHADMVEDQRAVVTLLSYAPSAVSDCGPCSTRALLRDGSDVTPATPEDAGTKLCRDSAGASGR